MTRNAKILIAAGLIALVGTAAVAGVSSARDDWRHGAQSAHGGGHHGYHKRQGHPGRHHGRRFERLLERFDSDGDGTLTQGEIDQARQANLAKFDSDGNGTLSLGEFEALWLDFMRERMVDRFQDLDSDGDAAVTLEEYREPFDSLVERMDRDGDGVLSRADRRKWQEGGRGRRDADD